VHATAAGAAPVTAVDDTPPSMEVLDAPAPPPASAASDRGVGTGPAPPARTTETAGAAGRLVTVRPGDHLWGIATDRVQLALGTEPAPREVHPYWSALIEVNRDRLLDPDDPDLLVPGQELVLPG
jgi:nucleoid-associated protein YgaU